MLEQGNPAVFTQVSILLSNNFDLLYKTKRSIEKILSLVLHL